MWLILSLFTTVSMRFAFAGTCIELDGGRVRAADLASRVPEFGAISGSTDLGPAPLPGVQRWIFPPELALWARRAGFAAKPETLPEICLKIRMEQLKPEQIREAVARTLSNWDSHATFDLDSYSKHDAPKGELVFPLQGLGRANGEASKAPLLWKGSVKYAERASFPIWAKVRISAERNAVVALEDLPAGKPIEAGGIAIEPRSTVPGGANWLASPGDAVGMTPRRLVPRGEALPANLLVARLAVGKGQRVEVSVANGGAKLGFIAVSESDGKTGDLVTLKNPTSGRRFRGQVVAQGKVAVQVAEYQGAN